MGKEVNLLENYPKSKRDPLKRLQKKSAQDQEIARKFSKEFFDGERKHGYGGYNYNPKFWLPVIPTFKKFWNIDKENSILDVGCGKGFMIFDFQNVIPEIKVKGVDISSYAIENSLPQIKDSTLVADAKNLPFENNSFDYVISINTIHNLDKNDCAKALKEITRVARLGSFITVDAYRNDEEKKLMYAWNLTAKTIMSVEEWKIFFKKNGYNGDYYWFIP